MIISHKHKFIFVKTKKTAGTTIEIALSKICGEEDIITPINPEDEILRKSFGGKTAQNYQIPFIKYTFKDWLRFLVKRKKKYYFNHMTALEIKQYLPKNIWDEYFIFCFERHPFTKVYSHYYWTGGDRVHGNIEGYINSKYPNKIKGDKYYNDSFGNLLVNKIYKMEELKNAFEDLKG